MIKTRLVYSPFRPMGSHRLPVWRWLTAAVAIGVVMMAAHISVSKEPLVSRIAFGSCANQSAPQPIWDAIVKYNPHVFSEKITNQRLLLDFLDEPQDSPRRQQAGVYTSYTFGPLGKQVKVILLDTRYHRDPLYSDGSILGTSQWTWLEKELKGPASAITIIGSSIQGIRVIACYQRVAIPVSDNLIKASDFLIALLLVLIRLLYVTISACIGCIHKYKLD